MKKTFLKYIMIIAIDIFLIVMLFNIYESKKIKADDYLKENFSDEEILFINENEIPLDKLKTYKQYKNFDVYEYWNYEKELKGGNYLKAINTVNAPFYYKPYENIKPSLFLNTSLVLTNKSYYLNHDYVPSALDNVKNYNFEFVSRINENMKGNKEALEALEKMFNDAKKDNISLVLFSAYRSFSKQEDLFYNVNREDDTVSAKPGFSEHQTGLAFDISTYEYGLTVYFDKTKEFEWLYNNCYKYGFILRFPKDKENKTFYSYEPWHYRYVGDKAKDIFENNLTLEEYILNNFEL